MKINHSLMRAALVLAAAAGLSQAAFADGLQKLGFIDTERVYRESKQAQNIEKTLQKEFAARQSKLQKLHREGESLEKSLAANKLSETERQETLQKLDALGRMAARRSRTAALIFPTTRRCWLNHYASSQRLE